MNKFKKLTNLKFKKSIKYSKKLWIIKINVKFYNKV